MAKLNLNELGTSNTQIYSIYHYWLASPYPNKNSSICCVYSDKTEVGETNNLARGIRPVIVISSSAQIRRYR